MEKIFITGGTGLVGHEMVKYILNTKKLAVESPKDIFCLVRTPQNALYLKKKGVTIIKGSLQNKKVIKNVFSKNTFTYVFHLAANIYVYAGLKNMLRDNYIGTKNILYEFGKSNAKSFIFASSIVVYNHTNTNGNHTNFEENYPFGTLKANKGNAYAISKRKAELLIQDYMLKYPKKNFTIARLSPIIGMYDRQMIPAITTAFRLKIPKLIDKGAGILSLTTSYDCARSMVFLAEYEDNSTGQAFNVAHTMLNYAQIFEIFAKYYSKPKPFFSIPKKLFILLEPLLIRVRNLLPDNLIVQTFLSDSTLDYLTHSYYYDSTKIKKLGFKYQNNVKDIIERALQFIDPDKNNLDR